MHSDRIFTKLSRWFIIVYMIILLIIGISEPAYFVGETESYLLPAVSIMNEQDLGISASDVELSHRWFPAWASMLNVESLSGYTDRSGQSLAFYFPTYSIVSVPILSMLHILRVSKMHAFVIANILILAIMLFLVEKQSKLSAKRKFILILALALNPSILYIYWASAEILIYALIALAMMYWVNRNYHRAAIFISIAGTMNPTVMAIGMVMILDYLIKLYISEHISSMRRGLAAIKKNALRIIRYGSCYLIFLIPCIYFYYNIGRLFMITASTLGDVNNTLAGRFIAYLFDLNFGFLPYYPVMLLLLALMFIQGIVRKKAMNLFICIALLGTIFAYSFMYHINSGMCTISRYNAWATPILLYGVIACCDFSRNRAISIVQEVAICLSVALTALILFLDGITFGTATSYLTFTPIAKYVMNNMPQLYDPLFSTFNNRVSHIDGGYYFSSMIIYENEEGDLRKALLRGIDASSLTAHTYGNDKAISYLVNQIEQSAPDDPNQFFYLSIRPEYSLKYIEKTYSLGDDILFYSEECNFNQYDVTGFSGNEGDYTWTNGHTATLTLPLEQYKSEDLKMDIDTAGVYAAPQNVTISVNGYQVYNDLLTGPTHLSIDIPANYITTSILKIRFDLPDAVAPSSSGTSNDSRTLCLAMQRISITGVNVE